MLVRRRVLHRYASTTDDVTHSSLYTEQLLCAHALTQSFVHREAFTHRRLYTEAFAQRSFYTQKLLQTDALHKDDLALLHTNAFTDRSFYTEKPFCTEQLLHKEVFLFPFKKGKQVFPQTAWPHWGVLMARVKARVFNRGGILSVWHFSCQFPRKMALVKCPCAFRLRRLAQNVVSGSVPGHFSCEFSHKMALVKCPCTFRPRRLAQNGVPGGVASNTSWLWWNVHMHFHCAARAKRDISYRNLAKRALVKRSCQETSYRDLANKALLEILYTDLAEGPLIEILYRDLVIYRDLTWRSLTCGDLF